MGFSDDNLVFTDSKKYGNLFETILICIGFFVGAKLCHKTRVKMRLSPRQDANQS